MAVGDVFVLDEFQSTLPRGSDYNVVQILCFAASISIHAPSRERPASHVSRLTMADFNPRSLAGATRSRRLGSTSQCISIHAPSRERPAFGDPTSAKVGISIHAPSRERRAISSMGCPLYAYFNPRSLAGATAY